MIRRSPTPPAAGPAGGPAPVSPDGAVGLTEAELRAALDDTEPAGHQLRPLPARRPPSDTPPDQGPDESGPA